MGLENPTHWIPIVVILLLLFGARRLPEIGRSLGSGMREFKDAITGGGDKPALAASTEREAAEPAAGPAPTVASQPPPAEDPAPTSAPAEPQRQA